jgi:thioredoxin 1
MAPFRLLVILVCIFASDGLLWGGGHVTRLATRAPVFAIRMLSAPTDEAELQSLTTRELKAQLKALGASAAAEACFEKSDLVRALHIARENAAAAPSPPAPAPPAPSAPAPARAEADLSVVQRLQALSVSELRQQLADRSVGWSDLIEKSELVARLAGLVTAEVRFCPSGRVPLGRVAELTEAEVRQELLDSSTPLLLDVYAKWCGPCQLMAPYLEKLAADLRGRVRVVKVDSDQATALSSELRVKGLPTLVAFRSGKEVHRAEGALPPDALRQLCDSYLLS